MKDIIRFHTTGRQKLIMSGVTDEQAREWCTDPLTRKEGKYFDGFASVDSHCINQRPYYDHYFKPNDTYY